MPPNTSSLMKISTTPISIVDSGYLERPEKVVARLLKTGGITSQYNHWTNLWLMMPSMAYRLASTFTTAIPSLSRMDSMLAHSYMDGANIIDRWAESTSTLLLVQDAVRRMLTRCLDAANYVVRVDDQEWDPRTHGQLGDFLSLYPGCIAVVTERTTGLDEATAAMHHLMSKHVYCEKCELTLRCDYPTLMGLPGTL